MVYRKKNCIQLGQQSRTIQKIHFHWKNLTKAMPHVRCSLDRLLKYRLIFIVFIAYTKKKGLINFCVPVHRISVYCFTSRYFEAWKKIQFHIWTGSTFVFRFTHELKKFSGFSVLINLKKLCVCICVHIVIVTPSE